MEHNSQTIKAERADMAQDVQNSTAMAGHSATTLESARRELLDRRVRVAMFAGVLAFSIDSLEPWLNFRDPVTVEIQLGAALLALCLIALSYTPWGARHKVAIFNSGFLIIAGGFEAVVCYKRAFGTQYSDGFPVLFAFYCVLIPASVLQTALMGLALSAVLSIPQTVVTGLIDRFTSENLNHISGFVILLFGRHIANELWKNQFIARQQSESFYKQVVQSEKMAALGRLAAGLAHELNNPLAIIASSVTSIERSAARLFAGKAQNETDNTSVTLFRAIERLRIGTERMSSVNDLLRQYVRPPVHEMVPSDVNSQIELALSLVESKIANKAITIHRPDRCGQMLLCDPQTLSHVFVNLLDNACDAVGVGGNIWISTEIKADGHLEIAVRDDGSGLDESLQDRLGEPFVTSKEPGKGLGLGLALCKLIVEKHSGRLEIANRYPGAEATITFPAGSLSPESSSAATVLRALTPDEQQPP